VFFNRTNKSQNKQPCTRCSILRLYFSAIFLLVIIYVLFGEKVSYLSFVNKITGVYIVFGFGGIVLLYRVIEWYFFLKEPRKSD